MTAGYSGTPLPTKLGLKPGTTVGLLDAPPHFVDLLEGRPDDLVLRTQARGPLGRKDLR